MARSPRTPRWYGIPVRVALMTFIGTLLSFAVTLLLAIVGTAIASKLRGVHPDMRVAYRDIAIPIALVAGALIMIFSFSMEMRHYRQMKTLSTIEKMN